MKLNIRSASIIIAGVFLINNLFNPIVNGFGNNLALVVVVSGLIVLCGHLLFTATGELGVMYEAQPAVEKIIAYDNIMKVGSGKVVLWDVPTIGGYQFVHTTAGLLAIDYIKEDKENIEFITSPDNDVHIIETKYTWASAVWQFFGNCPIPSTWQVAVPAGEMLPEEVPEL